MADVSFYQFLAIWNHAMLDKTLYINFERSCDVFGQREFVLSEPEVGEWK